MKRFALIGAAGYIAPRHMKAIKETDNELVAIHDIADSVGIIDSYFPNAKYFQEFERFERYVDKMRRGGTPIDYLSICTPNYLHDVHIRFALQNDMIAICEKPLVVSPWNLSILKEMDGLAGGKVFSIVQSRLHPSIEELKKKMVHEHGVCDVTLTYITTRGDWYLYSWKGNEKKSGGLVYNIGIHLFDILSWVFGRAKENVVHVYEPRRAAGYLQLEKANVKWYLSINQGDLPNTDSRMRRSMIVNGEDIDFTTGFEDLHTQSYQNILGGGGYRPSDVEEGIRIAYDIKQSKPSGVRGTVHPLLKQ